MGRPKKPIQRRSNGVYCVQMHLDGRRVMRSLQTRDLEVACLRAGQAMAELEAEHKARQQGATRWREAKEFAHLLDLADVVDIPTAAEGYTGQQERDEATGDYLDKTPKHSLRRSTRGRWRSSGTIWFVRWSGSAEERTGRPCQLAGTETWALPLSNVLSNWLRPLQKPSGSGSIKCRTQDSVVGPSTASAHCSRRWSPSA